MVDVLPTPAGFPRCPKCALVATASPAICMACVRQTISTSTKRCPVCSHPLLRGESCGNPICTWEDRTFETIYAICERTGSIERVLTSFKYAQQPSIGWATILGRLVLGWIEENLNPGDYDLIVANPTHKGRPVRHSELILEAAATEDVLGRWSIYPYALEKKYETNRSANGRWRAKWDAACELRGAVTSAGLRDFRGTRVLLFDDITTTCAQMQIVGEVLVGLGAAHVDGLVIARQVRRPPRQPTA